MQIKYPKHYQKMLSGDITSFTFLLFKTDNEQEKQQIKADFHNAQAKREKARLERVERETIARDKQYREKLTTMSDDQLINEYRNSFIEKRIFTRTGRDSRFIKGHLTDLIKSFADKRGLAV